jgi:hypothetical protein
MRAIRHAEVPRQLVRVGSPSSRARPTARARRPSWSLDLLREMRKTCGDFFPEEAWYEIHRCFAIPYVEVVLPTYVQNEWRVFLVRRQADDLHWPGAPWHIPGGIWRLSQTREEACNSIAMKEIDVPVGRVREVMSYKWQDHAYANPISHVCICEALAPPVETESARFHPVSNLPPDILLHHREFIEACIDRFQR